MADFFKDTAQFDQLVISPFFGRPDLEGLFGFGQFFSVDDQTHFFHFLDDLPSAAVLVDQISHDTIHNISFCYEIKKNIQKIKIITKEI